MRHLRFGDDDDDCQFAGDGQKSVNGGDGGGQVMSLSAVSRYAVLLANTGDQIRVARSYVLECRTNVVRRKAAGG